MRKRLYDIIEVKEEESLGSTLYDAFMLLTIIASIIPLCFKKQTAYGNHRSGNCNHIYHRLSVTVEHGRLQIKTV